MLEPEDSQASKNQTGQGQANPTKKLCCYKIYMTVYERNPRTIHECLIEKPAYTSCYTRLCITATRVYNNNKIQKGKKVNNFGHTTL